MAILREMDGRLVVTDNNEKLWIEPWGENALRVRSTKMPQMPPENWALEAPHSASAEIVVGEKEAAVTNGKITAKVTKAGKLTFYNSERQAAFGGIRPQPPGRDLPEVQRARRGRPRAQADSRRRFLGDRAV